METIEHAAGESVLAAPRWAVKMRRINDCVMKDACGGPRPLKFSWLINLQKGGTFFFLGLLMWHYSGRTPAATSMAAWIYLAIHGGYGLTWLMKDLSYPDPVWDVRITLASSVFVMFGLAWYWSFGWQLISGAFDPHYPLPDAPWFCLCVSLCVCGNAIMMAADAQKYFTLRIRRGLITDGMFRYIRHPNYLGEMMVYGGFGLMVWNRLPVLVLSYMWITMFAVNMVMKEASMARYPGWAAYKKRTWWLLPGLL